MFFIDIIIIILLLLLMLTIGVSVWSAWKSRSKDTACNRKHIVATAGITCLLMFVGLLFMPVSANTHTGWERVANMFIITIIGLTIILLFIAVTDLWKDRNAAK